MNEDPSHVAPTPVGRPVILVVDDDEDALRRVERELSRRYGADYRIVAMRDSQDALAHLRALHQESEEVALILADQWMSSLDGGSLLALSGSVFPRAKRGLLVEFGAWRDEPTARAILRAMATGGIDYYVLKPWRSPDELFNRTIAEFLHEWARVRPSGPREVLVVGPEELERTHEIKRILSCNGIPYLSKREDEEGGRALLERAALSEARAPVVGFHDGRLLVNPSNVEIADAFGFRTTPERTHADLVIVGAGPAGLSAAVYAASEGLDTLVVEREAIGGQAGSSSLIRNYLGFSRGISGAELAMRAYQQAWIFGASIVMMREVTGIEREGASRVVFLSNGSTVRARAVVLAMGVSYRRLGIPSLEALAGAGVFYGASVSEAQGFEGEEVVVLGGGNSAGQAAMHLARYARRVTIVVRGNALAASMSDYLIRQIEEAPNVEVMFGYEVVDARGAGRLEALVLGTSGSDERLTRPAAALFVLIGAHPHTDWLSANIARDDWGYIVTGAGSRAGTPGMYHPLPHETTMAGVFAAGDVRQGSMKRVGSAVGEGAAVVAEIQTFLQRLR